MPGDLSEFEKLAPAQQTQCRVMLMIAELGDKDREDVVEALATPTISSATIQRWFRARGVRAQSDGIRKHRREECCCA